METPCLRICRIHAGLCEGCLRTLDEIRHWQSYSDTERDHIMDEVLPKRRLLQENAAESPESMYNPNQTPES